MPELEISQRHASFAQLRQKAQSVLSAGLVPAETPGDVADRCAHLAGVLRQLATAFDRHGAFMERLDAGWDPHGGRGW